MYSTALSASIDGIVSRKVTVEADVSDGLPTFTMVGFLASETREAAERVRSALRNSGFSMGVRHITVNLAPASLHKEGSGFDLAIAVALLIAMGELPQSSAEGILLIGELGLNGDINPVRGVLEMVSHAGEYGCRTVIIPRRNLREGSVLSGRSTGDPDGLKVLGAENLAQAAAYLRNHPGGDDPGHADGDVSWQRVCGDEAGDRISSGGLFEECIDVESIRREQKEEQDKDFSQIRGQAVLRRACEIAVSGFHNILMIGPPGAGKTMAAKRIPTILPEMTLEEILEITKIHSIAGTLPEDAGLMTSRPFRSPHHTITSPALCGGGSPPHPGEVSLAHRGVLYLDELPEFDRNAIETLRQPLEDRSINISRVSGTFQFPAGFMLVASMNPCRCGYFPDHSRCSCSNAEVRRYLARISMPILDRIDMCVEAHRVEYDDLAGTDKSESSEEIRRRVTKAVNIQKRRYEGEKFLFNSDLDTEGVKKYCPLTGEETRWMKAVYTKLGLTARSWCRILKVARTIADLSGEEQIGMEHLMEAVSYRAIDRKYWESALRS